METLYSAFISYRHDDQDSAVAADVHNQLERLHIPAKIREKTGKNAIGNIFRDKEELPITNDLNETIADALDHSEYLIVICSTHLKESYWVPREIEYFLKNHSKEAILTVLVDGEPKEVIPEILQEDRQVHTAEDGSVSEEKVILEPLSCDYRQGFRKARREEIPRLAAAILGCSYEELMMRDRHYRLQRLAVITGTASVLMMIAISYLLWSRSEIRQHYERAEQNLEQSLANQSVYLSTESKRLIMEGDRIRAIQLAVEALPGEGKEDDRPLVPEAQAALSRALWAYHPLTSSPYLETRAELLTTGVIEEYYQSVNGSYICARDRYGQVYVWDSQTGKKLLHVSREFVNNASVFEVKPLGEECIVLRTSEGIEAWHIYSGKQLWSFADQKIDWDYSSLCVDKNSKKVMIGAAVDLFDEDDFSVGRLNTCIVLDSGTGEEESRITGDRQKYAWKVSGCAVSESGKKFALWGKDSETDSIYGDLVISFDLGDKSSVRMRLPDGDHKIAALRYTDDEHLCVKYYPDCRIDSFSETYSAARITKGTAVNVSSFSSADGKCLWTGKYVAHGMIMNAFSDIILYMARTEDSGAPQDYINYIICTDGDKTAVFRADNGEKYDEFETDSPVVNLEPVKDKVVLVYLSDGYYGSYRFEQNSPLYQTRLFRYENVGLERMTAEKEQRMRFLVRQDSRRLWIAEEVWDKDFMRFHADPLPPKKENGNCVYVKNRIIVGDYLMLSDEDDTVSFYDLNDEKPVIRVDLTNAVTDGERFDYIGKDDEKEEVWFYADYWVEKPFVCVSARDGSVKMFGDPTGRDRGGYHSISFCDGKLFLSYGDTIMTAQIKGDTLSPIGKFEDEDLTGYYRNCLFSDTGHFAVFSSGDTLDRNNTIYLIDLKNQKKTRLFSKLEDKPRYMDWNKDETVFAVTDGRIASVFDVSGDMIYQKELPGAAINYVFIHGDSLLVFFNEGRMACYDLHTGNMSGMYDIEYVSGGDGRYDGAEWKYCEDTAVFYNGDGLVIFFDPETWKQIGYAYPAYGYDSAEDRVICGEQTDSGETYVGYYPRYTVEDLLRKAREELGGSELSEEEKAWYGLD